MKHRWRMVKAPVGGKPMERCTRCGVFRHERGLRPGWVEAFTEKGQRILRDDCRASEKEKA